MKTSLFAAALAAAALNLLSSCQMLGFEEPLPKGAKDLKACPKEWLGDFRAKDTADFMPDAMHLEASADGQKITISSFKIFDSTALKDKKRFVVHLDSVFVLNKKGEIQGRYAVLKTKTGFETKPQVINSIDFKTQTFTQIDEVRSEKLSFLLRHRANSFYLNLKDDKSKLWQLVVVRMTADGFQLNLASSISTSIYEDNKAFYNKIMPLKRLNDTILSARPTNRQLDNWLADKRMNEWATYVRMK